MTDTALYQLIFPNGKVYVGVSVHPEVRWLDHKFAADHGGQLAVHRAIRRYGWENVKRVVLKRGPRAYILAEEVRLIAELGSYTDGYNSTPGGEASPSMVEEIAHKISVSLKKTMSSPEFKAKRSQASIAAHTPEMRQRKSESVRRRFADPEVKARHRAAMIAFHARRKLNR